VDVIIRGVDEDLYREFKAEASRRGMKLREALSEAMRLWIRSGEGPDDEFYRRIKGELLKKYRGKHVAISRGRIVAVADTFEEMVEALRRAGVKKALTVHVGEDVEEVREWPGFI